MDSSLRRFLDVDTAISSSVCRPRVPEVLPIGSMTPNYDHVEILRGNHPNSLSTIIVSGGPRRGAVPLGLAWPAVGVAHPHPQLEPPTQMVAGTGGGAGLDFRRVAGVGAVAFG